MDIKSEKKSDDDLEAELEEIESGEGDVKDLTIERLKEEIRLLKGRIKALEFNIEFEREAFERERRQAQEEIDSLKRERYLLRKQLDELLKPPLLLGEIMEILSEREVIVKSSTGQMFITSVYSKLDPRDISVGRRVAMDKNNLVIMRVLPPGKDPIVVAAEVIERPKETYADIGGLEEVIEEVKETVELPLLKPELFREIGIEPPKGVLLVGPPGTGKTLIAKAVANKTKATFIRLVGSELVQKFIGEGGRLVRELFQMAREKAPSIIFIDEIDAIGAKRMAMDTTGDREVQRTLMQLLAEMDGFKPLENVAIMAATNRMDILDEALLRPGRFDRIIRIELPDEEGRYQILKIHTRGMKLHKGVNLKSIAAATEGYSGADIRNLCTEAGMFAIREGKRRVTMDHFMKAKEKIDRKREEEESRRRIGDKGMYL
ncbi:MAG: proteasome-activating nucleotidase [Thermoplasmata archaeon]|nr:proteasome-activating nucleotidase [Thermoplasmata archaeon]